MRHPNNIMETPRPHAGGLARRDEANEFSFYHDGYFFDDKNRVVSTSENIMESLIMKGFCVCE
jgi:hypothetical protein